MSDPKTAEQINREHTGVFYNNVDIGPYANFSTRVDEVMKKVMLLERKVVAYEDALNKIAAWDERYPDEPWSVKLARQTLSLFTKP